MDKRSTKILIGCILCSLTVLCLFLIVLTFTRLSCELVVLDPVRLAAAQTAAFEARHAKAIRSHDETILMKISAYLEYNIQPEAPAEAPAPPDNRQPAEPARPANLSAPGPPANATQPAGAINQQQPTQPTAASGPLGLQPAPPPPPPPQQQQQQLTGGLAKSAAARPPALGPAPSAPQLGFVTGQQANGSTNAGPNNNFRPDAARPARQPLDGRAERRFLPLELRSIESRNPDKTRHKYILNFNCTKLNMVLAHQDNRVHVESMSVELQPPSQQATTCEVQLPATGAFTVADTTGLAAPAVAPVAAAQPAGAQAGAAANSSLGQPAAAPPGRSNHYPHFAHYYCAKPLHYNCYRSNGLLAAVLHINGIEFETSTSWQKKSHQVKSDFSSQRSECNVV